MRKVAQLLIVGTLVLATSGLLGGLAFAASQPGTRKACSRRASQGWARCHAQIVTDSHNKPLVTAGPVGYGPADFRNAYNVRGSNGTSVAVVVAYDAPNIISDLAVYSKAFGLPVPPGCTAANQPGCIKKVDQYGGHNFPTVDPGWAVEASLDVETVHGMCPSCRLIIVEASSASLADLSAAVDQAVSQGARVVSNSYGGPESSNEIGYDSHYKRSGVVMIASSGDSGYGTSYPAVSPGVVAVGGTDLHLSGGHLTSETAWLGSGSGCSKYEPKPSWQHDIKCKRRSMADIAADADPATGAAVYVSYPDNGRHGWFKVGGTSLAAPLVAGMLAVSGKLAGQPGWLYDTPGVTRDISSGHNGRCQTYLCTAATGYDGPTGLGVLKL